MTDYKNVEHKERAVLLRMLNTPPPPKRQPKDKKKPAK